MSSHNGYVSISEEFCAFVQTRFRALAQDKRGVTALEYGVLASAIILAIVAVVSTLGTNLSSVFSGLAAQV